MEFPPGTSVLAKQRGFPAWPAVVVDVDDVPDDVLGAKPRRRRVTPVMFYADRTFLWASDGDLRVLSLEDAKKGSKAPKTSRKLREAYSIAANPPHYKDYVAGTPAADSDEASVDNSDGAASEVEEQKGARRNRKKALPAAKKAPNRQRVSRVPATRARRQPTPSTTMKKRKIDQINDSAEDEDFLPEEEDSEDGDEMSLVEEDEESETGMSKKRKRKSRDPRETSEGRIALVKGARLVFQTLLGSSPAAEDELVAALDPIETIEGLEIAVIRVSKLQRVLRLVVSLPALPKDLKQRIEKLLEQWDTPAEPIIRGIPEEFAPDVPDESRDISAAPSDILSEPANGELQSSEPLGSESEAVDMKQES